MAVFILKDQKFYVASYDLTGDTSTVSIEHSAADLDVTAFGDSSVSRIAGLESITLSQEGFYQAGSGSVDEALSTRLGGAMRPITVGKSSGTDGDAAWMFNATTFSYTPFGAVGEATPFSTSAASDSVLVDATFLHDDSAAETSTGNGTARQLGAVAAGETLYASLHVLAASGTTPTLDVTIESDDDSGMASPATQITFTQATGTTSEWQTAAGAITDDWFRVAFTIGGGSPSFTFVVAVGIK